MAAGGSARKFKAPGMAATTPGASRLGAGSAAAAAKPAVQLHSLDGSLLKRLLAAGTATAAAGGSEAAVPQLPPLQPLPLDSTRCAQFRVPDVPAPPAAGSSSAAAAARPAPQAQEQQPAAAAASAPLVGWQELRERLVAAGANPAYATPAWSENHYRWVVWKLARLQLALTPSGSGGSSGGQSQPHVLTAAVALDELKLRCRRG